MKKVLLFLIFSACLTAQNFTGGFAYSRVTVAQLPAAASNTFMHYTVTNGANPADCTVGGGAFVVDCVSNGTVWQPTGAVVPGSPANSVQTNNGSNGFAGSNYQISGNTMQSNASGTTPTIQGGQDANVNSTEGSLFLIGGNITGAGGAASAGGGVILRGGNNAATNAASQAGSVQLYPGASTGATQGLPGLLMLGNVYQKGGTVTQWNLQHLSAANTTVDAGATPNDVIGVAENIQSNYVVVNNTGRLPVNASAAVTVGDTVCAGSTAGKVTDSGGTATCTNAQGATIGIVSAISGAWTLPDGTAITASSTLPIVQLGTPGVMTASGAPGAPTNSIQTNSGSGTFTGANVIITGGASPVIQGSSAGTNILMTGGQDNTANAAAGSLIVRGSSVTSGGGSSSMGGNAQLSAGFNGVNNASSQAGNLEVMGGVSYGATTGQQGLISLVAGYTGGATVTQWNLACSTGVLSTAADCAASALPTTLLGITSRATANIFDLVIFSGQSPINTTNTATIGHTICVSSVSSPKGVDSGGTGDCPSGQIKLGVVQAVSGTWNLPDAGSVTATTTLPIISMGTPSASGAGTGNVTTSGLTTGKLPKATGASAIGDSNLSENVSDGSDLAAKALNQASPNSQTATIAGTTTCDLSLSNDCVVTFAAAGNTTLAVTNPHGNGPYTFTFVESSSGNNAVTFPGTFPNPPGISPTASVSTIATCFYDGTVNYTCSQPRSSDTPTRLYGPTRAADTTPASGNLTMWFDSTDNAVESKNSSGTISKMPTPGVTLKWSSTNVLDVMGSGSVPGISGCGAGTQLGGNTIGSFHSGTSGTCTVTLTFALTASNGWACHANDLTTTSDTVIQTSTTTTTAVLSGPTASGDVVNFACFAY